MFGRKKKDRDAQEAGKQAASEQAPEQTSPEDEAARSAAEIRAQGPWDITEVSDLEGRMDLGSLLIAEQPGLGIRLEVKEKGARPRAVNLDLGGSSLQLQAFAAPRTTGLWEEIRTDLIASLRRGGGSPEVREGAFGVELQARFSATSSDGTKGYRPARFVGIDGPRWFLRAVISGPAAIEPQASARFDELIRSVVVRRGGEPMPPRDLLPLSVPEGVDPRPVAARRVVRRGGATPQAGGQQPAAQQPAAQQGGAQGAASSGRGATPAAPGRTPMAPPERGPEITETR